MIATAIAADALHAPIDRTRLGEILARLPAQTTYAQAIDALLTNAAVDQGEAEAAAGACAPHADVARRFEEKFRRRSATRA